MKRLVRSASGRQIYGQKWQNSTGEGSQLTEIAKVSDTDAGNTIPISIPIPIPILIPTSPPHANATIPGLGQDDENQKPKGHRKGNRSSCQSMYRAALVDDWVAAEMLLERDPTLLCDEITERGERALHVAVAMKHKKFVQELVQRMSPNDLEELQDRKGYTACCYAAISGEVDIADILMKKNPNLGTARDQNNVTPLQKAALRSSAKMVSQFLKSARAEDLLEEEWFDLLLLTIRRKMYGVALRILRKNGCSATMMNEEGTALHLLARQQILMTRAWWGYKNLFGRMQPDLRRLAKVLWAKIQRLGQDNVVELMNNPPILHDAAKAGNMELVTMLTRAYPDLIWHTDSDGYTIFHIAVIHKQECVFSLIHQIGCTKDFIAAAQDENGNNILHLAGKLTPLDRRNIVPLVGLQMQREITWFKKVEELVPPSCQEIKNNDGLTPREVFSKEHKMLREESETWMRNVADSCLLVSTIMLTVVFAAAFTVPGGYNSETGLPVLMSNNWFTCFIVSVRLNKLHSAVLGDHDNEFCRRQVLLCAAAEIESWTIWYVMVSRWHHHSFLLRLLFGVLCGKGTACPAFCPFRLCAASAVDYHALFLFMVCCSASREVIAGSVCPQTCEVHQPFQALARGLIGLWICRSISRALLLLHPFIALVRMIDRVILGLYYYIVLAYARAILLYLYKMYIICVINDDIQFCPHSYSILVGH